MLRCKSAERLRLIEELDLFERNTHLVKRCFAAEMLIGKEKYFFEPLIERPLEDRAVVRTFRDLAAVLAAKCLDGSAGIHVGDRTHLRGLDVLADLLPYVEYL